MRNNRGITLVSLVIYIAVVMVIAAAIIRITTYFRNNMEDVADVSFETEFQKINLYLLEESKQMGNGILQISEDGTQITFGKGNKYSYDAEEKKVYLNDTINVCENVEKCLFEQKTADNGKTVLSLTIKIGEKEKTVNYVFKEDGIIIATALLPKEYQQVEYIESTGTQYIDTGMKLNQDSKIELDFEITEDGNYRVFGSRSSATENNIGIITSSSSNEILVDFQSYTVNRLRISYDSSKKTYGISNEELRVGDNTQSVTSYSTFTTPENAYIFSMSGNPISYENAKMKLYYCKIWEGENLVRDFIPCYRKADDVIGLYDTVNDLFYTNAGTGDFIKGPEENTIIQIAGENQNYIKEEDYIFNIEGGDQTEEILLPAEYQQVEYIESTGTQYIDTGVKANSNIKLETSINGNYNSSAWYGGRTGSYIGIYNYNGRFDWMGITGEGKSIVVNPSNNEWHNISHGKELIIDNQLIIEYEEEEYTTDFNIYLFAGNNNGTVASYSTIKMKEIIIYENDNIVREFIPCYRKSDGVVGLYDKVNNEFYTNAGTGEFTKGANVN